MAGILDLPPELVISISSHLTTEELGPLRRSCRQLEKHLFESFAREFFTKRQFMVEHVSIQTLVDIANHPTLSQYLVEVLISTEMFEGKMLPATGASVHTSRECFLSTGEARDMLAEAFSKLPNLRTVGLRDWNGAGRVRDGRNAGWRSYGWSLNENVPLSSSTHDTNPSLIFCLLLRALGTASTVPNNLEVILRRHEKLMPEAFRVNTVNAPVISRLKTLFLALGADGVDSRDGTPLRDDDHIRRLLHTATDLEVLRLNFHSYASDPAVVSALLGWVGTLPKATDLSINDHNLREIPPAPLRNLTVLDIGMVTTSSSSLLRALSRFRLKAFSLWKVSLKSMDPNRQSLVDDWAPFLEVLSATLADSVQEALIGGASQSFSGNHPGCRVRFVPANTVDKAKLEVAALLYDVKFLRAHYGLTAADWLKSLSERTYIDLIHAPPPPPDSESEESNEDDGENEDEDESMDDE